MLLMPSDKMDIVVKRFGELSCAELYEILRCRTEIFVVEQGVPYQELDGVDAASTHLYVADGERIIAYLRIIDPGVRHPGAVIGRVLTMKGYRRRGLARSLMKKGIEIAFRLSDRIEIEAQTYLREFYTSLGFRQTSEEFIYESRPHISMLLNSCDIADHEP